MEEEGECGRRRKGSAEGGGKGVMEEEEGECGRRRKGSAGGGGRGVREEEGE